jgi:hypothetical protein
MTAAVARRGFYVRLDRQVLCECGCVATHQVRITQLRMIWGGSSFKEMVQVMPLCDECYQLFLSEDHERHS